MTALGTVIAKGLHSARPAAGTAGSLYYETDTTTLFRDNGASWDSVASNGSAVTDATISTTDVTTNNVSTSKHGWAPKAPNDATKYLDGTGAYTVPAGGGGGSDLVQTNSGAGSVYIPGLRGSPDAKPASPNAKDDEFEALSGWTTLGTVDTSNVSDFASHWHGKRACSSEIDGIYKAVPSTPFTITVKFSSFLLDATGGTHPSIGIMLLDSTPTAVREFSWNRTTTTVGPSLRRYTNRTSFSSSVDVNVTSGSGAADATVWQNRTPIWLKLLVTSSSSVTFSYSVDGFIYTTPTSLSAISPTITPAYMGLLLSDPVGVSTPECVVDYFRVT